MALSYQSETLQELKQQVSGTVLTPEDAGYEKARWGFNLDNVQHPALILVAQNADDVAAGVRYAARAGLGVAIQSTGHGMQRPADDALLIVTSEMRGVTVDVEARTARAAAGAVWKDVLDVTTPHGLAPLLGSSPYVGVVGYTLGGGVGWLARPYGLAADSVVAIDIVTPDGEQRRASATENSDLFWALRGGSGNFGVVTAITFSLYPVATLYGGFLLYPGELAREALTFYRDWTQTLPDALTTSLGIVKFPDLPQMPDAIRGKTQVFVRGAYNGNADEGAAYIQQWIDWRTPLTNTFREMPFSEVGTISNDPVDPGPGYGTNEMFDTLTDEALDIIARHAVNRQSPVVFSELRHVGGAVARVPQDANAIGNRDAQYYFQMGGPIFSPDAKAATIAYIKQYKADLQSHLRGGVYLNFMKGSESESRVQDAYLPESLQRLRRVKAQYDPDNLFRFSFKLV